MLVMQNAPFRAIHSFIKKTKTFLAVKYCKTYDAPVFFNLLLVLLFIFYSLSVRIVCGSLV